MHQISHTRKCIFIHIPKNAGKSIEKKLFGEEYGGHYPISFFKQTYPEQFKHYFKFCVVRNPWDKLVSAYHYLKSGRMANSQKFQKYTTFRQFVVEYVNMLSHDQLIDHVKTQSWFITIDGGVCVDEILKFETLDHDFEKIKNKVNYEDVLPHIGELKREHYTHYYDDETIKIVENLYKEDIERFGYKYDI